MKNLVKILSITFIVGLFFVGGNSVKALSAPKASINNVNYNTVNIKFNKVSGASGYQIFRSNVKYGTYSLVKTTSYNSYNNTKLKPNKTYYYIVRSYKKSNGRIYYSGLSNIVATTAKPGKTSLKVTPNSSYLKLNYTKVNNASGYIIYRATSANGNYTAIKNTKSLSYTNSVGHGKKYCYKVKAYQKVGKSYYYGSLTNAVCGTIKNQSVNVSTPTINTKLINGNNIKISIGSVNGVNGYEIYRTTSNNFTLISKTSNTTYTDYNLNYNQKYTYKVRAYKIINNQTYYSSFSNLASTTVYQDTSTKAPSISVIGKNNYILINIDGYSNDLGYEIYRSTSRNGRYYYLGHTATDYRDYDVNSNQTYYYKAKSYKRINGSDYYSDYSNIDYDKIINSSYNTYYNSYEYYSIPSANKGASSITYQVSFKTPKELSTTNIKNVKINSLSYLKAVTTQSELNNYKLYYQDWYNISYSPYRFPLDLIRTSYMAKGISFYNYSIINDNTVSITVRFNANSSLQYYQNQMLVPTKIKVNWKYEKK